MNPSRAVAVLAASLLLPLSSGLAQAPVEEPSKWSLSLGVDPTNLDLRTRDPGVSASVVGTLTREWRAPNSSIGRYISLMLGGDSPIRSGATAENCFGCWTSVSTRYASLTAGLTWDLVHVSRFTPYARTGAGLYYTSRSGNTTSGGVLTSQTIYSTRQWSPGGNAGFGIKAKLGSHEFFIEQMLHAFDLRHIDRGVYPINFGINF